MPDPLGDLSFTWPFYAAAIYGYLLGAIPFGLLIVRFAGRGDPRDTGAGTVDSAALWRARRRDLAVLTLLLDGGKGALAALSAGWFGLDFAVLAGGGAVLGHSFPVWLGFRGGRGAATTLATLSAVAPVIGALAVLAWLPAAALARISSLATPIAISAAGLAAWLLRDVRLWGLFPSSLQIFEFCVFLAAVVWLRHVGALRRLVTGTAPRSGDPPSETPGR